jgi:hypothetical protein
VPNPLAGKGKPAGPSIPNPLGGKGKPAAPSIPNPLGGKGKPAGGLSALAPRTPVNKPKPSGVSHEQLRNALEVGAEQACSATPELLTRTANLLTDCLVGVTS